MRTESLRSRVRNCERSSWAPPKPSHPWREYSRVLWALIMTNDHLCSWRQLPAIWDVCIRIPFCTKRWTRLGVLSQYFTLHRKNANIVYYRITVEMWQTLIGQFYQTWNLSVTTSISTLNSQSRNARQMQITHNPRNTKKVYDQKRNRREPFWVTLERKLINKKMNLS